MHCNKSNIIHVSSTSASACRLSASSLTASSGVLEVVGTPCLSPRVPCPVLDKEPPVNIQQTIYIVYTVYAHKFSSITVNSKCMQHYFTRYLGNL